MITIDGKQTAEHIYEDLKQKIKDLKENHDTIPGLSIIIVGDKSDSVIYVRMKEKMCHRLGIKSQVVRMPGNSTQQQVIEKVKELNNDSTIHGILIQLPLPKHLNEFDILHTVDINKDVDGFHQTNMYKLFLNQNPPFYPCTPDGCMELLRKHGIKIEGKNAVVIGRSRIVGLPMALMLNHANATVTLCHSKTIDVKSYTQKADIIIVACGKPEFIKKDWIKEGVTIIDVGINRVDYPASKKGYKIVGDVDFNDVKDKVSAITPVPGGVGPMTIAMLMKHAVQSAMNSVM